MNPIDNVFTLDNFRLIIEHAPIGIVIIDKDLKWLLANRRFSEICGYSREELQQNEAEYKIYYTDNGPGIDSKVAPYVFDMFYKGSENATGSGLGLYISKKAIEKLKGRIEILPNEQMGCTFKISIPISN